MPRSYNQVILLGHLGQDAEVKFIQSGSSVANFSIATENRYKDKQSGEWKTSADWHRIVMWDAEKVAPYLKKGKAVHVTGRLQTRSYEDSTGTKRYVTEVVARDLILLGGAQGGGERTAEVPAQVDTSGELGGEDVPF